MALKGTQPSRMASSVLMIFLGEFLFLFVQRDQVALWHHILYFFPSSCLGG